jgi:hypothetical protein
MAIKRIVAEFQQIASLYPGLKMVLRENTYWIEGKIKFNAVFGDISIEDQYDIQISLDNFPDSVPSVIESGKRINRIPDNHIDSKGVLCLGNRLECYEKCQESLVSFFDNLLIPFLYANSYKEKYKKYPWPTLNHFSAGILQYYAELFEKTELEISEFFENISILNTIKGHHQCFCGKDKKYRDCCRKHLIKIINDPKKYKIFLGDVILVKDFFSKKYKLKKFIREYFKQLIGVEARFNRYNIRNILKIIK